MAYLFCCRNKIKAKTHNLPSISARYKSQNLLDSNCPNCKRRKMAWYGITDCNDKGPTHKIKWKEQQEWIDRLPLPREDRQGRPRVVFDSEYLEEITKDPKNNFEHIIFRATKPVKSVQVPDHKRAIVFPFKGKPERIKISL